jgi:hypothetical protein
MAHAIRAYYRDRSEVIIAVLTKPIGGLSKVIGWVWLLTIPNALMMGPPTILSKRRLCNATIKIAQATSLHQFAVIPKRSVFERFFTQLETCSSLRKNFKRKLCTSLNMAEVHIRPFLHKDYDQAFIIFGIFIIGIFINLGIN